MLMARLRDTARASRRALVVAAPPAASMAAATSSCAWASAAADRATSVSYTHLDVYKRQILARELGRNPSEVLLEDTGSWLVEGPLKGVR